MPPVERLLELPINQLNVPSSLAFSPFATTADDDLLESSIRERGIFEPLIVTESGPEQFVVIDGVRRLRAAVHLGLATIPCLVHPPMSEGDQAQLRFELHDTVVPWTKRDMKTAVKRLRARGAKVPPLSQAWEDVVA